MIEAGEGHLHSGFLAGGGEQGNSAVGGVPAAGEAHRSLCGRHRQATGVHAYEQIVEAKVAQKPFKGGGNWIKVNRAILNNATYLNGIKPRSLKTPAGLTRER